jgi:putative membrane protein
MPGISLTIMAVAGLLHIGFFVIESLLWRRPDVHRIFGVRSEDDAETMAFALFNQGYYNLFLAIGTFVGIGLSSGLLADGKHELVIFCALFMVGAAVVLVASNSKLWRGAVLQGGLPALALLLALVL